MSAAAKNSGLENVIAGETAISSLEGGLTYRGYPIEELAESATFPEVAYLLLHGELPSQEELADFQALLDESADLPEGVVRILEDIPLNVPTMDALRTAVSALGHFDTQPDDDDEHADRSRAIRLLGAIPRVIAIRARQRRGLEPVEPDPELSFAGSLLHQITGKEPSSLEERALDVSLILYAEHEFNASTFTARVVRSTGSDLYSAITAAIGALKGPLHGGANELVLDVLERVGTPDQAERWVRDALRRKERIMGFGHRVYRDGDPRAELLRDFCRQLSERRRDRSLEVTADTIARVVLEEKGLHPNLDWPSARLYHYLRFEVELYTPLFVASRTAGWAAHAIEQAANNRLIRPLSKYVGEPRRSYTGLDHRG
jgi:citrate synthase